MAEASIDGRRITLDALMPIEPLEIHPRRVENSLPAGLRMDWLSGTGEGVEFTLTCGAGLGSPYLILSVKPEGESSREEIVDLRDVLPGWVDRVLKSGPTPAVDG